MAKDDMNFSNYGGKEDFLPCEDGKIADFVSSSGGPVDAFGDVEKKEKGTQDQNAARAFSEKEMFKVDTMGTDEACKGGRPGQFMDNKGDHFKTEVMNEDIDAMGTDCGKSKSFQTSKRSG